MTDNEIIKALECCVKAPYCSEKTDCPYKGIDEFAMGVIKRQDAKIERLKGIIDRQSDVISEQKEKIERIYAEAVKEFAERLCKDRVSNDPVVIAVKVELETAGAESG